MSTGELGPPADRELSRGSTGENTGFLAATTETSSGGREQRGRTDRDGETNSTLQGSPAPGLLGLLRGLARANIDRSRQANASVRQI